METKEFKIKLKDGIDAKLLSKIINLASTFDSKIFFATSGEKADAKSLINLMSLNFIHNEKLVIEADGWDEPIAVREIQKLLEENQVI